MDANTLIQGAGSSWNSFTVPDLTLNSGQTYRIYVIRSDAHDYPGANNISWSSSDSGDDEYPPGTSSGGSPNIDFTFRVYDNGVLNQSMETDEYGYAIYNSSYQWQEFVPVS